MVLAPGQAHNGSGKTTCFVLAMLSRMDPQLAQPQALCVCPTRELVVQNLQVLERMGRHAGITATSTAAADFEVTRCARTRRDRPGRPPGPRPSCCVGTCRNLRCRLHAALRSSCLEPDFQAASLHITLFPFFFFLCHKGRTAQDLDARAAGRPARGPAAVWAAR
jgi:hypothetical protein